MFRILGKDLHSPKYISPTDLKEAHNEAVKAVERQQEQEEQKKRQLQATSDKSPNDQLSKTKRSHASPKKLAWLLFFAFDQAGDQSKEAKESRKEYPKKSID